MAAIEWTPATLLGVGLGACLSTLVLTPLVRRVAAARGWVDVPDEARKSQRAPVPSLGGIAVFVGFWMAALTGLLLLGTWADTRSYVQPLFVASTAILALGILDDRIGVGPLPKLAVQTLASGWLYWHGYRIDVVSNPFGDALQLGDLSLPCTLLWFLAVTNALNLIDGLDGLAAGVGLFAAGTSCVVALVNGRVDVAVLALALAGALLGFLRYNFTPASIYLGDSGALLIGFVLAALSVHGSAKSPMAVAVAAPFLSLALPLLDVALAIVRRTLAGQPLFQADADHIHHRLLRLGLPPRTAVALLYVVTGMFAALSLLTMTAESQVMGLVIIVFSAITWVGIRQLGYVEMIPGMASRSALLALEKVCGEAVTLVDLEARLQGRLALSGFREVRLTLRQHRVQDTIPLPTDAWAWRLPVVVGGQLVGELVMDRPLSERGPLQPSAEELARVLSTEVARAVERLRPAPAPGPAQTPAEVAEPCPSRS